MSRSSPRRPSGSSRRLVATFRHTRSLAVTWLAASIVVFFASSYAFGRVLAALRGTSLEPITIPAFAPVDSVGWLVVSSVLVVLVVILHELIHGACLSYYGGDPGYGIGLSYFVLPYAYAATGGTNYTRNQLLVVLLAPVVGITAIGLGAMVVSPSPLLLVPLAANAAGSVGDLWMAGVLLQYPETVRIAERPDADGRGFGIYASGDASVGRRPGTQALSRFVTGTLATSALLVIGLVGAVFASLAVGSGTVVVGDPGTRWFLFRHEFHPTGSDVVRLEIRAARLVTIALAGGLGWTLWNE